MLTRTCAGLMNEVKKSPAKLLSSGLLRQAPLFFTSLCSANLTALCLRTADPAS
jgi:hypothetical protein